MTHIHYILVCIQHARACLALVRIACGICVSVSFIHMLKYKRFKEKKNCEEIGIEENLFAYNM